MTGAPKLCKTPRMVSPVCRLVVWGASYPIFFCPPIFSPSISCLSSNFLSFDFLSSDSLSSDFLSDFLAPDFLTSVFPPADFLSSYRILRWLVTNKTVRVPIEDMGDPTRYAGGSRLCFVEPKESEVSHATASSGPPETMT